MFGLERLLYYYTYLLHDPTAVALGGQCQNVILHGISQDLFLELVAMLKEFLNDIVAKDVGHELVGFAKDLVKDHGLIVAACSFELVLYEARSVLISTELDHMSTNVLSMGSDATEIDSRR